MGVRWNPIGFQLCFLVLILCLEIQASWSLNDEGLILLEFRSKVSSDPYGVFANWNSHDNNACFWSGVQCSDGKVQVLDLKGLSLEGTLAPALGKLRHLRSLVLYKNHFSGTIPNELGGLTKLELLDLRDNNFSGTIPLEIRRLPLLKSLLLCNNKFEGSSLLEISKLNYFSELQFDENLVCTAAPGIGSTDMKFRNEVWQSSLKHLNRVYSLIIVLKGAMMRYFNSLLLPLFTLGKDSLQEFDNSCCEKPASSSEPNAVQNVEILVNAARRRLLEESTNLEAAPAGDGSSQEVIALPIIHSSGSFPAVPTTNTPATQVPVPSSSQSPSTSASTDQQTSGNTWLYFLFIPVVLSFLILALGLLFMCRKRGVTTIGPWKTGLSGQLQKAFVTGVPKLNRVELETACEDFSNIIDTHDGCIMYKGTLSSGIEIAVASTLVGSSKEWSKNAEMAYRKKIDTLSRINHKNFVNLIGFCEENEPFNRMMVFEYAPNGTLFEHLHIKEMEHLDWNARMRIIMGTAYCLQYMHHDLNPPVAHSNLNSHNIYLTDDYAAKIAEIYFLPQRASKSKHSFESDSEHSVLPPLADVETNVYSFGILLLEVISGKLQYSDEQGPLEKWASEYLSDKRSISYMIDPTLKAFKNRELDVICEIIQECIQPDPRQRPTMKDITARLREVIPISPDQATPRLSPLWWAELEILSVEAT